MTNDMLFSFGVVALAGVLLASGRVRLDIVALLVVLSLVLGGILSPTEAFAGFGDPVVIMVAGLLVISEMLTRTGVAQQIGNWLVRHGRAGEIRLLVLLTLVVAALGCFMSNTAVVAIFIPVVLSVATSTNLNASRLLMPLAFAAIVSGMITLIATTSNLVVSAALVRAGFEPLGLFSIAPIGLSVLVVFLIYMVVVGRHLLPGERFAPPKTVVRSLRDLLTEFELPGTSVRLRVPVRSPLVGRSLAASALGHEFDVRVIIVERFGPLGSRTTAAPTAELEIREGDVLVVRASDSAIKNVQAAYRLRALPVTDADRARWMRETGIAKILVHPDSRLIGNTIRKIGLRPSYGVQVLGLRRKNATLDSFLDQEIRSGDAMLVVGPWSRIRQLQSELRDFVVLALPAEIEQVAPEWKRAPVALAIALGMIALSVLEIVPTAIAVTICALLAVLTRCLTMEQAYGAIRWSSLVLLAGMMSIAQALKKTGAFELLADELVRSVGDAGPHAMVAALFALTALLSMVLSGAVTAIILAPIAIRAATDLDVSPYPFAITVAIAASAGFVMPVSSSAVMLVMGPGNYRLRDFFRVGTPLLILTALITILLAPILFPFRP